MFSELSHINMRLQCYYFLYYYFLSNRPADPIMASYYPHAEVRGRNSVSKRALLLYYSLDSNLTWRHCIQLQTTKSKQNVFEDVQNEDPFLLLILVKKINYYLTFSKTFSISFSIKRIKFSTLLEQNHITNTNNKFLIVI